MSDPPVGGERGCAQRPKKRQSVGLCPAAAPGSRGTGDWGSPLCWHRAATQSTEASSATPVPPPRISSSLREESRGQARGLSAQHKSAASPGALASRPPASRTHPSRPPRRPAPPSPGLGRGRPHPQGGRGDPPAATRGDHRSQAKLRQPPNSGWDGVGDVGSLQPQGPSCGVGGESGP